MRVGRLQRVASRLRPSVATTLAASHPERYFHASKSQYAGPEKTPFQVFVDTFKTEWGKSKELQEGIKALQDETGKMSESEAFKRAKDALSKAKDGTSAASSVTGKTIRKAGQVVGDAAAHAWESPVIKASRDAVSKTADSVDRATEPIRKTELYKNVKEVIDDGSSIRYGGFEEKEARRLRRKADEKKRLDRLLKEGMAAPAHANPEAGSAVEVHATAKPEKNWSEEFEKSQLGKKLGDLRLMYEESDNSIVSTVRSITDKLGSLFEETESGRVVKMFKDMDPTFRQDDFLRDVRQYILPEVLDAYVKGDAEILKQWLSEAPFNIWATSAKQYKDQGLYSAGRVLDIRGVDILSIKLLQPSEIPVFVIGCRAQEVHLYRNSKTNEIAAGMEDHIQMSTYAMVLTRIPEEMENEETKGWKLLELVRGQTREYM
jgi:mitochondrial import inner membrane translocase subunit TIM44